MVSGMAKRRRKRRQDENRVSKICIGIILGVFVAVMTVQIHKVYQKDLEKIALEAELDEQLKYEMNRQQELREYQKYIESQEYVEAKYSALLSSRDRYLLEPIEWPKGSKAS